jgi:prepilin signal peptidase PulO-like enzyme (type II secretory pathway)
MGSEPQRESIGEPLAVVLAIAAAAGYFLAWSLFHGSSGCGPPAHSTQGRIFVASPFVLPLLAAATLLAVAAKLRWRRRAVMAAVLTTLGSGAMIEFLIFILEFGAHHCGE